MFRRLFRPASKRFEDSFFERGVWAESPFTERLGVWGEIVGFQSDDELATPYSDWLHRDPREQCCFTRDEHEELYDEELSADDMAARDAYDRLRELVSEDLVHLVLHARYDEAKRSVVGISCGVSSRGPWLAGVATQQICHNTCD